MSEPLQTVAARVHGDAAMLHKIAAGDGVISYRAAGDLSAPALVALHGVGSGSASWTAQLDELPARGFRVVAWDAPGYGDSTALAASAPSAGEYAAALADFVAALGLERFTLIGHSLGALIAAAYCRGTEARRIERLVLASPAAGYGSLPGETRQRRTEERLAAMARLGPAGLAAERAAVLLSPHASAAAVEQVRTVMRALRPEGYAQAVRMLGAADIFADAVGIKVPTLVLCGSADTVTPEAGCRRVAEAIPGAAYEALAGLGHAAYVEDATRFNAALLRFLDAEKIR